MSKSIHVLITASAIALLAQACANRRVQYVNDAGTPLVAYHGATDEYFRFNAAVIDGGQGVDWVNTLGYYLNSSTIVAQCEQYLRNVDAWEPPRPIDTPIPPVYPPAFAPPPERLYAVPRTMTIVCLDPVIVIISTGTTVWLEKAVESWDVKSKAATLSWKTVLRHGFRSGRRLPYSDEVSWFSPTLKIGPEAPQRISADERRIPTNWGALILRRAGECWAVDAEAN